jgi:hypothetical protein
MQSGFTASEIVKQYKLSGKKLWDICPNLALPGKILLAASCVE